MKLLKIVAIIALTGLAFFEGKAQAPTNGYPPKVNSNGNQYNRLRADSAQHVPHKYSLTQNTTDSTPQIFVWSTPSGDSLVLFVNGRYIVIRTSGGGAAIDTTNLSFRMDTIAAALDGKIGRGDSSGVHGFKTLADFNRVRDSLGRLIDNKVIDYFGDVNGVQYNTFANRPNYVGSEGTLYLAANNGGIYLARDTGWVTISSPSGGASTNRGAGYRLAEPGDSVNTISTTDGIGADSTTNKGITLFNNGLPQRLEFIDTVATTTYQNDNLIGATLLYVQNEDVPIGAIPRTTAYYTFNPTTGIITLVNALFNANDKVTVLYRGPYINNRTPGTIGTLASVSSFPDMSLFTTDSPAGAFSSANNRIVMRSFNVGSMWGDGGDCLHYNFFTNDEQIYYENDIKIGTQGDGLGFAVMWGSGPSLYSTYSSIFAAANLKVLTAPKLVMWQGGNPGTGLDSVNFPSTIALGDTIRLRLTRSKGQLIGKMTCLRTGTTVSDTVNFSYTPTTTFQMPRTYKWGTAKFGTGVDSLIRISMVSQSVSRPKAIFMGDSKTSGLYAGSTSGRYSELVSANPLYSPMAVYAAGGDRTNDCLHAVDYIITYVKPKYVFLNMGRNDGMPFPSQGKTNYQTIVSRLEGAGIKVFHVGPMTETSIPDQSTLANFIQSTYGTANYIDVSTGWVNGTMLAADGVHPNTLGNTTISTNILNASKIKY